MENAAKALIIVGTILIAMILISLSLLILNSTGGIRQISEQNVSITEVTAFNNFFLNYEGNNVNAAKVKSLIQIINANNAEYDFYSNTPHGTDKYIEIKGIDLINKMTVSKNYKVYISEYNKNGYISEITIEENM